MIWMHFRPWPLFILLSACQRAICPTGCWWLRRQCPINSSLLWRRLSPGPRRFALELSCPCRTSRELPAVAGCTHRVYSFYQTLVKVYVWDPHRRIGSMQVLWSRTLIFLLQWELRTPHKQTTHIRGYATFSAILLIVLKEQTNFLPPKKPLYRSETG